MTVSERLLQFLARLSRRSDLVIAVLMLLAVVMMLIPLPTRVTIVPAATATSSAGIWATSPSPTVSSE